MPTCPKCGAEAVPIVYGMPGPELIEQAERGQLVLGGCVITDEEPNWACKGPMQHQWVGESLGTAHRTSWTHEQAFRRIALIIDQVEAETRMPVTRSRIAGELARDAYVVQAAYERDRSVESVAKNMVDWWTARFTKGDNPYAAHYKRLTVGRGTAYQRSSLSEGQGEPL